MKRFIAILLSLLAVLTMCHTAVFADDINQTSSEQVGGTEDRNGLTLYRYKKKIFHRLPYRTDIWTLYKVELYSEYTLREYGYSEDQYQLVYVHDITYERVQEYERQYSTDTRLIKNLKRSRTGYVYNSAYDGTGSEKILTYDTAGKTDSNGRTYIEYNGRKYYYRGTCDLYDYSVYSEYYYHYYSWDEWSKWSETPVTANEDCQVETKPGKRITYNANGGQNAPSPIAIGLDDSFTISTTIPKQQGCQFLGWSTSATGDVEYLPGDTCLATSVDTLYAVWDFIGMISVVIMPEKTQYIVGESFDSTGLVIFYSSMDGSKGYITEGFTATGFDSVTPGVKTIVITYLDYTTTFEISVIDRGLCGGNVIWTYDGEGTLTISGTGSMGSYSATDMPWYNYLTAITTVVIETGVTRIGNYAFYGCNNLTSVSIPDSVTRIGSYAFGACEYLRNIVIPDSVVGIGESALSGCVRLESITIPFVGNSRKTSTDNYQYPFGYIFGTTEYLYAHKTEQNYYGYSTSSTISTIYYLPDSLQSVTVTGGYIPYGAFELCDMTDVTLGNNVTAIGDNAFYYCSSLKNLSIGESVTAIGNNAFYSCYNLSDILIGNSVTSIGNKAFYNCRKLTNITIGNGLTKIGANAFEDCAELKNVYITDIKAWCEIAFDGLYANPLMYADYLYLNDKLVTDVIIPDGATIIGDYAFYSYDNLATVGIPESVTEIGYNAFYGCNNLTDVYYAGTTEQWSQITSTIPSYHPIKKAFVEYNYDLSTLGHTHSYGKWSVVSPSTFTTNGLQKKVCSICGDTVTEALDLLVGKVSHWNIVLEDDYAVNFYLQISESIESTAKVKISIGNETLSHNISAMEKTGDGYYKVTVNISAAQMNDQIIVIVINDRDIGSTATYTARQYCDTILTDSTYSRYHALVKEMLNYGAMAQIYFDYDTGYLANEGITGTATTEIPEIAEDLTVTDKISDLSFYGASLVYRDRIAVRYYFAGDVTGCAFSANGNTYTPVSKDGMYYIEIADILPQNLDQQITLTVTDAKGNTLTVAYGPMNYIVRMNQKESENLKNLLKALYNYHLAAKALQSA